MEITVDAKIKELKSKIDETYKILGELLLLNLEEYREDYVDNLLNCHRKIFEIRRSI